MNTSETCFIKSLVCRADQLLYRDFNKEAVYKALARKGETLKHLWQKYNAIGVVDGKEANELSPVLQALQRMG